LTVAAAKKEKEGRKREERREKREERRENYTVVTRTYDWEEVEETTKLLVVHGFPFSSISPPILS
jgi:Mg2+ and Co2+ transporter CorA